MKPKIVIVAGGLATRMQSLTQDIPKALIDVNGKPLVQHQIEFFQKAGFTNLILCIGHLGHKIKDYFEDGSNFGVNITYFQDDLLGTAGSVKLAENDAEDICIVFYGDNLTTMNFDNLLNFHNKKNSDFTVVLKEMSEGSVGSSFVQLENDKITSFVERPKEENVKHLKNYRNNGIYVMNKKIFSLIPPNKKYDFGYDLIPDLIAKKFNVHGYVSNEFFRELGTREKYEKIKEDKTANKLLK